MIYICVGPEKSLLFGGKPPFILTLTKLTLIMRLKRWGRGHDTGTQGSSAGEGESTTKSHLKLQCREFKVNRIRRDAAAVEEEKTNHDSTF